MHALHFWVIGGDQRQLKLAELLAEEGHTVHTWALPAEGTVGTLLSAESLAGVERADCVVLPLPVAGEKVELNAPLWEGRMALWDLFQAMRPGQFVVGGRITEQVFRLAKEQGLVCRDYFAREELAVLNAVPTAEGAVQLAMENLPITLHSCRALVLGYGRVGRALARTLQGLGAFVTVGARRYEQLALAETDGCTAQKLEDLAGWLCGYDLVINTIPARILSRRELEDTKADCLIIDLASKPGGVDLAAAGELGRTVIWALSLPGKVAPVTAGAAIKQTIYNMLRELGPQRPGKEGLP